MREVASFMQMYPAYKLRDVLEEYAVVFFSLLNEGYRQRYADYRMRAHIALTPHLKDSSRKQFLRDLEAATQDFSDILKPTGQGSSPEELKKLLG